MTETSAQAGPPVTAEATAMPAPKPAKPGLGDTLRALRHRKVLAMLVFGMAAGFPYVILTGTLFAWFTEVGVSVKTIGVFSWTSILLGFKFLWSPAIDRAAFPALLSMGQRRAGILILQSLIMASMATIAFLDPTDETQLLIIAAATIVGVFAFASQDILIDAWRIEVADEIQSIDILSTVYQIGFRIAAIMGGAGALFLSARFGWYPTFLILVCFMGLAMSGVFLAEDSPVTRHRKFDLEDAPPLRWRNLTILPVLLGWGWSIITLFSFMAYALQNPDLANARSFTRETGPLIVAVSVILPVVGAAVLLYRYRALQTSRSAINAGATRPWPLQRVLNALYGSVVEPMIDLVDRLKFGAILVLLLVLSYRFTDLVWGAFAYPFYLGDQYGALGHTLDEVAIASKIFGALMIALGLVIGGFAILRIGRMPCLVLGAILAAATNLLYADLAKGGAATDIFLSTLHLYEPMIFIFQPLASLFNLDAAVNEKLVRLMAVITAENLAVGFASAANVVFLSSIVNPRYAAVQYALLASLTMLIGTLGRGALGEMIEAPDKGYAYVFYLTAAMGLVAVVASALEWFRQAHTGPAGITPTKAA